MNQEGGIILKISMSQLKPGEFAKVTDIDSPITLRLEELGLTVGTVIECVLRSPLSDPTAYRIRGALIAIRGRDCENITVDRM